MQMQFDIENPKPKYITFKYDEFLNWLYKIDPQGESVKPVDDAVVIRRQDFFAPPALDAYANNIQMLAVLTEDPEVAARLKDIADYFHDQAVASWHADRKLPD